MLSRKSASKQRRGVAGDARRWVKIFVDIGRLTLITQAPPPNRRVAQTSRCARQSLAGGARQATHKQWNQRFFPNTVAGAKKGPPPDARHHGHKIIPMVCRRSTSSVLFGGTTFDDLTPLSLLLSSAEPRRSLDDAGDGSRSFS